MRLRNKETGEIGYAIFINADDADYARTIRMRFGGNLYAFRTMKEMMDRFEDYKPAEPLIKDEKNRKAVRAWAEANDIDRVWHEYASCWLRGNGLQIELENEVVDLPQDNYAIAELCGEEEE